MDIRYTFGYTAEFWQYDARLGRRWNVDPIQHPSLSSYSSFANNPISYSDQLGLDTIFKTVDGIETQRNPGGEEDVWIIEQLPPVEVKPAPTGNMQDNPYREGSLPWQVFNRNISNPNLWNNRSTFSWAGSGQSQWIRDFNRGFGTLLLVGMTGPLAEEALGALAVGTVKTAAAVPAFISNVSYYSQYAAWRTYSTYKAVTSSQLYFSTLGYTSKIMGMCQIQLVGGGFTGYFGEDISTPDFPTGRLPLDLGIQAGTLLDFYIKELNRMNFRKIIIKTFKESLFVILTVFIGWFLLTWIFGVSQSIQPGSANRKYKSITFEEVVQEIPNILIIAIGVGLLYFIIGYSYNKGKFRKRKKKRERRIGE